jgi:hypothetical protein
VRAPLRRRSRRTILWLAALGQVLGVKTQTVVVTGLPATRSGRADAAGTTEAAAIDVKQKQGAYRYVTQTEVSVPKPVFNAATPR